MLIQITFQLSWLYATKNLLSLNSMSTNMNFYLIFYMSLSLTDYHKGSMLIICSLKCSYDFDFKKYLITLHIDSQFSIQVVKIFTRFQTVFCIDFCYLINLQFTFPSFYIKYLTLIKNILGLFFCIIKTSLSIFSIKTNKF